MPMIYDISGRKRDLTGEQLYYVCVRALDLADVNYSDRHDWGSPVLELSTGILVAACRSKDTVVHDAILNRPPMVEVEISSSELGEIDNNPQKVGE